MSLCVDPGSLLFCPQLSETFLLSAVRLSGETASDRMKEGFSEVSPGRGCFSGQSAEKTRFVRRNISLAGENCSQRRRRGRWRKTAQPSFDCDSFRTSSSERPEYLATVSSGIPSESIRTAIAEAAFASPSAKPSFRANLSCAILSRSVFVIQFLLLSEARHGVIRPWESSRERIS